MNLIKLNAIDSTNTYLKQLAKETQLPNPTIVVAKRQFAGRGQMGNGWLSKEGQSLTFSVFQAFGMLHIERQFGVSMAVSLAILKALQSLNVPKLSIKWPNDILSANKKIGGILIENVLTGNIVKYAIIGVGINVNETDFHELPQASSMKLETGETFQLEELQDVLLRNMLEKLKKLSTFDFSEMKFNYEENLFQKGKVSVFETSENSRFNGIIKGVSNIGELLVDTENEGLRKFQLKEVKLIF